jgi:tetratricopeptide (TPR) repeat protein
MVAHPLRWLLGGIVLIVAIWQLAPPAQALWHFRRGQVAFARYRNQEALRHLERALKTWPDDEETRILAARAARRTGQFDQAEQHLRYCQRLRPSPSPDLVLEWSMFRAASGDMLEVEAYLFEQTQKRPDMVKLIWEALAEGYLLTYRIDDALRMLDGWLAQEPQNLAALALRGRLFQVVNSHAKAAQDFRTGVEIDAQQDELRRRLAVSLMEIGRYDEALDHWQYLAQHIGRDPGILVNMARCEERTNNSDAALGLLAEVLSQYPDNGLALRTRGQLELARDHPAEAEDWLRKAVAAMPFDYRTHYALHASLEMQHRSEPAKAELETMQNLKDRLERMGHIISHEMSENPRSSDLHLELGKQLISVGRKEEGTTWLLSAVKLDPENLGAHTALADLYREAGNIEQEEYHREQARMIREKKAKSMR